MDFENNQTFIEEQNGLIPDAESPLFNLTKKDLLFALLSVLVCIFTAVFGIFSNFAIGYSASIVLIYCLLFSYFYKKSKCVFSAIIYGILSLLNCAVFICSTNSSVKFFSVIICFLLSILSFNALRNGNDKSNRESLCVFFSAVSTVKNISVSIKSLFITESGNKKSIGKTLVGLLCSIPVLIIVVSLLISSDDAFRGMMNKIFSNTLSTVLKSVFGVILSVFLIAYGFSLKNNRMTTPKESNFKGIENIYINSFLSTICASYILYLFSQLAYFFSAFRGFLPDIDATYAQYARKGFFEMSIVAVINLCLVFVSLLLAKKEDGKVSCGIKILLTFISIFTLIIIATAISKMVLYIDTYGMTILRLTTSSFMLFLSIVFISIILRIYIKKINVIKTALITACCIVLTLGSANVEAVCAKYNYEAYKTQKLETIDIEALYNLGDEGIPYIIKLGGSKDKDTALKARQYLAKAYLYDYYDNMENAENFTLSDLKANQKDSGFYYFNIPRHNAYDKLYKFIEKNPWFASISKEYVDELNENYYVFTEN